MGEVDARVRIYLDLAQSRFSLPVLLRVNTFFFLSFCWCFTLICLFHTFLRRNTYIVFQLTSPLSLNHRSASPGSGDENRIRPSQEAARLLQTFNGEQALWDSSNIVASVLIES
jgi:hypothetical protein